MKRMLVLVLALLWSTAPAMAQKQTFTGAWNWMWPNDTLRQIYPNIRSMTVSSNGYIYLSMVASQPTDGLYVSRDSGATFNKIPVSAFDQTISVGSGYLVWAVCAADSGVVLAGTDCNLFRSTNDGETWKQVLSGPTERYSAIVYAGGDTVFVGGYLGIYRSTDNGISWTNVDSNRVDTSFAYRKFNFVNCFTVAANGYIYAGTGSGLGTYSYGILRSTDGGNTWSYANNGITKSVPDTLDWNANIASLATVGDTVFAASTTLYRSTDNGASWQAMSTRFYNNESGAMINTKIGLIVPTLNILWLTTDRGNTWENLYTSQEPINVWSGVQYTDSTVLMGMWNGLGKLTIDDPITAVVEKPPVARTFALSQNYPNPFNPTTTIEYSLPQRTNVNLTVYNVLGQMVTTLANGMEGPGQHQVVFDGSSLASGTYLYVLEAGTYRSVQKMMLIK